MRPIAGKQLLIAEQIAARKSVRALFADMSERLSALVMRSADRSERIPRSAERRVLTVAAGIVMGYFVGFDGRNAFAEDGVSPLAMFPRILTFHAAHVQQQVAITQRDWMRRNVPDDVQEWLQRPALRETGILKENPVALYESAHTWVDPNGYILSDRIWQAGMRTRLKIDAFLSDGIRQGHSALQMARGLEGFLLPGRLSRRTSRPYGRDASADAMRLTRTEVSHAHAQMTLVASRTNPYVSGMDWALSFQHPRFDVCDGLASIGMTGQRLKEPYPLMSAPTPPAHPFCMCHTRPAVTKTPEQVTTELRGAMDRNERVPYRTPLDDDFLRDLLGPVLLRLLTSRVGLGEMRYAA